MLCMCSARNRWFSFHISDLRTPEVKHAVDSMSDKDAGAGIVRIYDPDLVHEYPKVFPKVLNET